MDLTPFLMSVIHGAKETAGKMLDHGANLMVTDSERNSCLHLAVLNRRIETLRMLLVRGRKWKLMELRNNELKSVIHLAACYNEKEVNLEAASREKKSCDAKTYARSRCFETSMKRCLIAVSYSLKFLNLGSVHFATPLNTYGYKGKRLLIFKLLIKYMLSLGKALRIVRRRRAFV